MNTDVLQQTVLRLNAAWQPLGLYTMEQAIKWLCSEHPRTGKHPGMALDFRTVTDGSGFSVLTDLHPVFWEEWVTLPVREGDLCLRSGHCAIRAPRVVICREYDKLHLSEETFSPSAVWKRDGNRCQYTNEVVTRETGNLDHVVPRDLGGTDSFENVVVSKKSLNTMKGNRLNHQVGLKLLRKPVAPKPVPPVVELRRTVKDPVLQLFLQ